MNRIEISPSKNGKQTKTEFPAKESNSNQKVKFAMAKELISMGLHIRSVERLLNIRLDSGIKQKSSKNGVDHGC